MANRFQVSWGTVSVIWPELEAIRLLLTHTDWTHVINLSIFDFPVRPIDEYQAYLHHPSRININFLGRDEGSVRGRQKVEHQGLISEISA